MANPVYTATRLESLVNHVALPPRLPGRQDGKLNEIESDLIAFLMNAASKVDSGNELGDLRRSLQTCKVVNADRRLRKSSLLTAFRELQVDEFLILHVVEQNAALVIRRDHG